MTAPVAVDVLAVMHCTAETLIRMKGAGANAKLVHLQHGALFKARDAVEELIKVGQEVEKADRDATTTDELMDRFRAALIACGADDARKTLTQAQQAQEANLRG